MRIRVCVYAHERVRVHAGMHASDVNTRRAGPVFKGRTRSALLCVRCVNGAQELVFECYAYSYWSIHCPPHRRLRSTTTTLLPCARYLAAAFSALMPAYLSKRKRLRKQIYVLKSCIHVASFMWHHSD